MKLEMGKLKAAYFKSRVAKALFRISMFLLLLLCAQIVTGSFLLLPDVIWGEIGRFLGEEYPKMGNLNHLTREIYLLYPLQNILAQTFGMMPLQKLPNSVELSHFCQMRFSNPFEAMTMLISGPKRNLLASSSVLCESVVEFTIANPGVVVAHREAIESYLIEAKCIEQIITYHLHFELKTRIDDVRISTRSAQYAMESNHIFNEIMDSKNQLNWFLMAGYVAGKLPIVKIVEMIAQTFGANTSIVKLILLLSIILKNERLTAEESSVLKERINFALETLPLDERSKLTIHSLVEFRTGNFEILKEYLRQAEYPRLLAYFLVAGVYENAPSDILQLIHPDRYLKYWVDVLYDIFHLKDPLILSRLSEILRGELDFKYLFHQIPLKVFEELMAGGDFSFVREIEEDFVKFPTFFSFFFYYVPSRIDVVARFFETTNRGVNSDIRSIEMPNEIFLRILIDPALRIILTSPERNIMFRIKAAVLATALRDHFYILSQNFDSISKSLWVCAIDLNSSFTRRDWKMLFMLSDSIPNYFRNEQVDMGKIMSMVLQPNNHYHLQSLINLIAPVFGNYLHHFAKDLKSIFLSEYI